MSEPEIILRVAAKGDGITAAGRHVALTAPGDIVSADGGIIPGPHHATPPCRHFPQCGGCLLQHLDEASLAEFVADRVVNAARGQGLEPALIGAPQLSAPRTRRRATLHASRSASGVAIGYRESGTHRVVDMRECHVLRPELFDLVAPLRALLNRWPGKRMAADLHLAVADQGVTVELSGLTLDGLPQTEGLLGFAQANRLARLTLDQGYGAEALWEPDPVTVTLGGVAVALPPGGFLQATADGEAALVAAVRGWLGDAATVADLFAGLGTFAFALAGPAKVLAVEAAQNAHLACKAAAARTGKPVHALHRDLYRNPLRTEELNRFAAVVLDPPRSGARDQVEQLAVSTVARIAYISCNPASWAKDAATLIAGGYTLAELRSVGQFRWSTHVELASLFVR